MYETTTLISIAENSPENAAITRTIKNAAIYNAALFEYEFVDSREGVWLDLVATTIAVMHIPMNEKTILKRILLYLKAIIFKSNSVLVSEFLNRYLSKSKVTIVEKRAKTIPATGLKLKSLYDAVTIPAYDR